MQKAIDPQNLYILSAPSAGRETSKAEASPYVKYVTVCQRSLVQFS